MNREKANLTTKELSKKTGISEQYIKRIEKGDCIGISISKVCKLKSSLGISSEELFEGI